MIPSDGDVKTIATHMLTDVLSCSTLTGVDKNAVKSPAAMAGFNCSVILTLSTYHVYWHSDSAQSMYSVGVAVEQLHVLVLLSTVATVKYLSPLYMQAVVRTISKVENCSLQEAWNKFSSYQWQYLCINVYIYIYMLHVIPYIHNYKWYLRKFTVFVYPYTSIMFK